MTKSTRDSRAGMGNRTRLVHAGRQPFENFGFVNTPIYRGSTVLSPDVEALYARKARFIYGTKGTPTTEALENAWSEIAGAAGTVLTPSGLVGNYCRDPQRRKSRRPHSGNGFRLPADPQFL